MMILFALALLAGEPQGLTVDAASREVRVPCKIAPRKLPNLAEIYPIEVIATQPAPKGQKAHETVLTFTVMPQEVQKALEGLGLKAGKPARGDDAVASGAELEVLLELPGKKRVAIESVLVDRKTGRPLPPLAWHLTGSVVKQIDPAKPDKVYAADASGTLMGIFPVTDELVIQSSLTMKEEGLIKLETAKDRLPAEGTEVVLVIKPASGSRPAASPVPVRQAAEDAVLGQSHEIPLTPVKAAPVTAAAPATAAAIDPFQYRRGVDAGSTAPEDARGGPLPLPPFPK